MTPLSFSKTAGTKCVTFCTSKSRSGIQTALKTMGFSEPFERISTCKPGLTADARFYRYHPGKTDFETSSLPTRKSEIAMKFEMLAVSSMKSANANGEVRREDG
jgi:hypothetical protein